MRINNNKRFGRLIDTAGDYPTRGGVRDSKAKRVARPPVWVEVSSERTQELDDELRSFELEHATNLRNVRVDA